MEARIGDPPGNGAVRVRAPASELAILTCAVVGSIPTGNPNQPRTRDEVIASAIAAVAAGASIVHIHARSRAGEITQSPEDYIAIKRGILAEVEDVVLNFTTGGRIGMAALERRRSLEAQPDVASLNCGSINFGPGDEVFLNPRPLINELAAEMAARGIIPEYECFDIGMAVTARRLIEATDRPSGMMHLVLGVVGGAPPRPETISLFADCVPVGVPWMVTAIGRDNFPMMAVALAHGGHVRTGLEDVAYTARGIYAESNAELVARARTLCEVIGRRVATPAETREILGISVPAHH